MLVLQVRNHLAGKKKVARNLDLPSVNIARSMVIEVMIAVAIIPEVILVSLFFFFLLVIPFRRLLVIHLVLLFLPDFFGLLRRGWSLRCRCRPLDGGTISPVLYGGTISPLL
jgi:hypothetical protein